MTAEAVGQIVLELDDAGAPTHRYLWGPAVDQILADEEVDNGGAEDVRWPLTDHLGTVRDLVSSSGSIVQHRTIDSFGKIVQETTAVDHLFALTGRPLDPDTGLQNHLNRWYDPLTGRWRSEDPIGFEGGDANYYRYCGNDPTRAVDPLGTQYYIDPNAPFFPPPKGPRIWEKEFWTRDNLADVGWQILGGNPASDLVCPMPIGAAAAAAKATGRAAAGAAGKQAVTAAAPRILSRIKESPRLVRGAKGAGKAVQESLDRLTQQLAKGNLNPGIGTKPIGKGISEARAADGARIYFRQLRDGTIEILGKSDKANQGKVIEEILRLFGG